MNRYFYIWSAILVVGGGAFWGFRDSGSSDQRIAPHDSSGIAPAVQFMCAGRVEAIDGEIQVSADVSGTLTVVTVAEGELVQRGDVLAVVDGRREQAQLKLAKARLARLIAGFGEEERAAARAAWQAAETEHSFAKVEFERGVELRASRVLTEEEYDRRRQRVEALHHQIARAKADYEAMARGPLPSEIAAAEAEVELASVQYEMRNIRAPFSGRVLEVYRRAGDQVLIHYPSPILRMADASRLQVRAEVDESEVYRIYEGMRGTIMVFGENEPTGNVAIRQVIPSFGPKRLFDPDTSKRMDTRTLQVLCDIDGLQRQVFPGQRVLVTFRADASGSTERAFSPLGMSHPSDENETTPD